MAWVAVGVGAVALLNSAAEEASENAQMERNAEAFGIRKAGIEATKESALETLKLQAAQLSESSTAVRTDIDRTQAQAEAHARVNAAASGTTGGSVNLTIAESEVNAARAESTINRKEAATQKQLKLNFVNTVINADTQIGELDTSTQDQTGKHLLAFGAGFLSRYRKKP